jgi:choline dehydrogenase
MYRFIRKWMKQYAIAGTISEERDPDCSLQNDDEIITALRSAGQADYHACRTCRMANFDDAVLDARCHVREIVGLRVVDGPIMTSAWRAA